MSFNFGNAVLGAAVGLTRGGPAGALIGGAAGGFANVNPGTVGGNFDNLGLAGILAQEEHNQLAIMEENVKHNERMQWQSTWFNEMLDQRAESMRESNQLRNIAMEQRKADNEITREFVKSIRE